MTIPSLVTSFSLANFAIGNKATNALLTEDPPEESATTCQKIHKACKLFFKYSPIVSCPILSTKGLLFLLNTYSITKKDYDDEYEVLLILNFASFFLGGIGAYLNRTSTAT